MSMEMSNTSTTTGHHRSTKWSPNRKVSVGALAGAITVLVVWATHTFAPEVEIPPAVASALTMILTVVMSYFVPEPIHSGTAME